MKTVTIAFFGHRDAIRSDIYHKLIITIEGIIKINPSTNFEFYLGKYGNADEICLTVLKELKMTYSNITVTLIYAYLPVKVNEKIESLYDKTLYPQGFESKPKRFAIVYRNRWIVENADIVILYLNKEKGGVYTAFKYAKSKNKQILNIGDYLCNI